MEWKVGTYLFNGEKKAPGAEPLYTTYDVTADELEEFKTSVKEYLVLMKENGYVKSHSVIHVDSGVLLDFYYDSTPYDEEKEFNCLITSLTGEEVGSPAHSMMKEKLQNVMGKQDEDFGR